jgi:thiamine-phosphate pyrophosphorylase
MPAEEKVMINIEQIGGKLHILTDRELAKPKTLIEVVEQAIKGGATAIQLRDKTASDEEMINLGQQILRLTAENNIPLIINDRVKVAIFLKAQGIHVGQSDMPAIQVRQLVGPNMILGVSASTVEQALKAQNDGADYLGVGPIFPTLTKTDADPPIGLEGFKKIRDAVHIPIIAIGSINKSNARDVISSGADGIAVISAVMGTVNPLEATHELSIMIGSNKKFR